MAGDTIPLFDHLMALRAMDVRLAEERDRRYAEVASEREKALKIKETADLAALELAREIQTYKDEKANNLRTQIERERGSYATQSDLRSVEDKLVALIKPISEFVNTSAGRSGGLNQGWVVLVAVIPIAIALWALLGK